MKFKAYPAGLVVSAVADEQPVEVKVCVQISVTAHSDNKVTWDVMIWDGTRTDFGLAFAPGVDPSIWGFESQTPEGL